MLGVIDDVAKRIKHGFSSDGALIYLLGETADEFGGSEWASVVHGFLGGPPPAADLAREQALAEVLIAAASEQLVDSAHDLAEGGLAQALVEAVLRGDSGARIELPASLDPFVALFSETTARAVVSLPRAAVERFTALCAEHGVPATAIGSVDVLAPALEVVGQFSVPVRELRAASTRTLPDIFG